MKIYEMEWFVLVKLKFRGGRYFFTYKVIFIFCFIYSEYFCLYYSLSVAKFIDLEMYQKYLSEVS